MGSVCREGRHLRLWPNLLLRLVSGTYFALTSLYCLLAFLPYTYCSFIKAPPYAWMPGFTHHQAALYWLAVAAATLANWPVRESWSQRNSLFLCGLVVLAACGICLTIRPFLPGLQNDRGAYWWSWVSPGVIALVWRPAG